FPGDRFSVELPASGFFHVNGTNPFYLYAGLTASVGKCSVAMIQESLFRSSYHLHVVGPLELMFDIFVVAIVKTADREAIMTGPSDGVKRAADQCIDVPGTVWSGCYFQLTESERQSNGSFLVAMDSSSSSQFGAYLFAFNIDRRDTICSHLGMPKILPASIDYDFNYYLSSQRFNMEAATTETPSQLNVTTSNTQTPVDTTMEYEQHTATTRPSNGTTLPPKGNMDITPTEPPNGNVDITPSGPMLCRQGVPTLLTNKTLTTKEVQETVDEIVNHLSVKTEKLSSVKRSKISAIDDRVSSTTMGMGGLIFIGIVFGFVLVSDMRKLVHDLKIAVGNTCKKK
ncbi:hypothetical protein EGW08_004925, partial [Elysia chlorotica]